MKAERIPGKPGKTKLERIEGASVANFASAYQFQCWVIDVLAEPDEEPEPDKYNVLGLTEYEVGAITAGWPQDEAFYASPLGRLMARIAAALREACYATPVLGTAQDAGST